MREKKQIISLIFTFVMGLMVTFGNELIRFNPSNSHIEYSTNRGSTWYTRNSGSSIGNVKSLVVYGNELILCSDKGVYYSTNKGATWYMRSSQKDFVDLNDGGKELLAGTSDGHLYYSTNKGATWYRRR